MKACYLLLLGLVALAHGMEMRSSEESSEESSEPESFEDSWEDSREDSMLVECPHMGMQCRMFCPLGFRHGKDGCPSCECIEDPCELQDCGEGYECVPADHCTGFPCFSMKADCNPEVPEVPCAMPMCGNECPKGYKNDATGCMTCECNDEEPKDPLCVDHPCPMAHTCVTVTPPFCEMMGKCEKMAMCLPDAHGGMFLPDLPEHIPGEIPGLKDLPEALTSVCKFRTEFSKKLSEEAKIKYGNSSMLGRLLRHGAMRNPWCTDDGKFRPLQCHVPEKQCWCVNDRGHPLADTKASINTKADIPSCVEHITQKIEGEFLMQHTLDDAVPHLTKIASLVHDHLAQWMQLDHAQINVRQVSTTRGGLIEVHFELQRTSENELHSAELMLGWHLGNLDTGLPYEDTMLMPVKNSLKMEHHTYAVDDEGMEAELPDHGLWMRTGHKHSKKDDFMSFYHHNKVPVIVGGVGIFLFIIFLTAIIVTVCKRARVTSNHFKHKRMEEKKKTYKENLAFANDLYGQPGVEKPGLEPDVQPEEEKKDEADA